MGVWRRPARSAGPLPAVAAALLVVLAAAMPAAAHAVLLESDPSDGAEIDAPPDQVVLLFNEPVDEPRVAVVGPDGEEVVDGAPVADGSEVVQELADLDEPGAHEIAYRVVSDDGHVVDGELTFTLAASPEPAPTADTSPTPTPAPSTPTPADDRLTGTEAGGGDAPPWRLLGAAGVLVAVAGGATALLRGRGG